MKFKSILKYIPAIRPSWSRSWVILSSLIILVSTYIAPAQPQKPCNKQEYKLVTKIIASEPIKINTAEAKDLMKLKGVGQKRAEDILAYRAKHGRFKSLQQLKRVPGVSTRLLKDNQGLIELD